MIKKLKEWWKASPEEIEKAKPPKRPATILDDDPLDAFDDDAS